MDLLSEDSGIMITKLLQRYWKSSKHRGSAGVDPDYQRRLEQEIKNYQNDVNVHALPEIFHYWSNKYVRPWFEELDTTHPENLFVKYLQEAAKRSDRNVPRFVSIGAGNCDAEAEIASALIDAGLKSFELECLDINESMLSRGRALAKERGLEEYMTFVKADFNDWHPRGSYDAVVANQCLHHVTNLEGLFRAIESSLGPSGLFIVSDMIGRNGHQRWPEAEELVRGIWSELDDRYKFNHQLKRLELDFVNHDCASDSFEGIRAQDILPLLVNRFSFHVFIGFGNVVDIFIDRAFGHNFDAKSEGDQAFIDKLHAIDEQGFDDGSLKPTHMVAVMGRKDNAAVVHPYFARGLSPQRALRLPS